MTDRQVALVSGANRGIGREIAGQLASRGLTVVVGSRDADAGRAAAAEIGGGALAHPLDVRDAASVASIAGWLRSDVGRLDVLVNNAGIAIDAGVAGVEPDFAAMRETFETNTLGSWRLTTAVLPLMRETGAGRIVNLSSGMGQLSDMGGSSPGYRLSKVSLNAMTRILASELGDSGILVNSACPGWVRTDMGGEYARRSVEEGADTPVWLATLPGDGPTGGFFRDRQPIPW